MATPRTLSVVVNTGSATERTRPPHTPTTRPPLAVNASGDVDAEARHWKRVHWNPTIASDVLTVTCTKEHRVARGMWQGARPQAKRSEKHRKLPQAVLAAALLAEAPEATAAPTAPTVRLDVAPPAGSAGTIVYVPVRVSAAPDGGWRSDERARHELTAYVPGGQPRLFGDAEAAAPRRGRRASAVARAA